jgi:hypothetical protein
VASAQSIGADLGLEEKIPEDTRLPGVEMLVDGSILQKILLPQYDEQRRLTSVLRADTLVLINDRTIEAKDVDIDFFHPDRRPKAAIRMISARLLDKKILRSKDEVALSSEDMVVTGTGLIYELNESRGLIRGPATARIYETTETAMQPKPYRHLFSTGPTMMAAAALHAAPLPELTPAEKQGLDVLAGSRADLATTSAAKARAQQETTAALEAGADDSLRSFLRDAALTGIKQPPPDLQLAVAPPEAPADKQLLATIKARQGIFFDSAQAALVFLDSVTVNHPEFTLSGADEIKVFMEQKAEDGASPDPAAEKDPTREFGDPQRVVATGEVVIERKATQAGDKAVKASGRQMVMDLKTQEVIIRGGQPWIISEGASGRVTDPDGYILINIKSGDASFVGSSEGFVELEEER